MASSPLCRFENRTRSKWRFPRTVKSAKGRTSKRFGNTWVLGDVQDADITDASRTAKCPNPVGLISEADLKNLGDANLRVLKALVKRGDVVDHGRALERLFPEKSAA